MAVMSTGGRDDIPVALALLRKAFAHERDPEMIAALNLAADLIQFVEDVSYGAGDCPADLGDRLAQARAVMFGNEDPTSDA